MSLDGPSMQSPPASGKKSRKRQRVSCVECTKRRQKCDRQYPCGLCVSRGVAHLCRWESGPVARPAPARPPAIPQDNNSELMLTITTLSDRIATLEQNISASVHSLFYSPSDSTNVAAPSNSFLSSKSSTDAPPLSPTPSIAQDSELHEAAVTLAQLSLGNRGEYMGTGSVVCALYELGSDPAHIIIPYAKSTESTSTNTAHTLSLDPIQALARSLPSKKLTDELVASFFLECNWRYGLPEEWFRTACSNMWRALGTNNPTKENVNANWLSLLFMVLALTPSHKIVSLLGTNPASREIFFKNAMSARRLAEDVLFIAPSFSDGHSAAEGTVLSCYAAVLMGTYLADRGRISEAWKLIGGATRAAQAAGMHRDPLWNKWGEMCEDERLLRRRGWWSLVICDRLYSYVLGRPGMIQRGDFDVPLPSQNCSDDPYDVFQTAMVQLSEIVDEVDRKCLYPDKSSYSDLLGVDRRCEEWAAGLPPHFRWNHPTISMGANISEPSVERQRHEIAVWYLACRMNLHRPWLMRKNPPFMSSFPPDSPATNPNPSRERCLSLAMELVHIQCLAENNSYASDVLDDNDFCRTFFLFDGIVNIVCALAFSPGNIYEQEGLALVDHAIDILSEAGKHGEKGEISRRAVAVLTFLKKSWVRTVPAEDSSCRSLSSTQESNVAKRMTRATATNDSRRLVSGFSHPTQLKQFSSGALVTSPLELSLSRGTYASNLTTHFPTSSSTRAGEGVPMHPQSTIYGACHNTSDTQDHVPTVTWSGNPPGLITTAPTWDTANSEGGARPDVLMMLPFDILQDMPLDEHWGGPNLEYRW